MEYLGRIEDVIEEYVSDKETVNDLHAIYDLLFGREVAAMVKTASIS
jgi:hypothetical protein